MPRLLLSLWINLYMLASWKKHICITDMISLLVFIFLVYGWIRILEMYPGWELMLCIIRKAKFTSEMVCAYIKLKIRFIPYIIYSISSACVKHTQGVSKSARICMFDNHTGICNSSSRVTCSLLSTTLI